MCGYIASYDSVQVMVVRKGNKLLGLMWVKVMLFTHNLYAIHVYNINIRNVRTGVLAVVMCLENLLVVTYCYVLYY